MPASKSDFTQAKADAICERLAGGESLRTICDDPAMPAQSTVFKWLAANSGFAEQYAHARTAQADTLFDEILAIADDGRNDWMARQGEDAGPGYVANGEALRRSQLRIDARKWMASKLMPKKYGEKLDLSGDLNTNVRPDFSMLSPDERCIMRTLLEKSGAAK